ncbi:glycoside hydrolase, family 16 [Xylariaceae sp. FL1272]|nr:glycoside hydrolase, family 16 [Xylariaceae sp. FL1272]
MRLPVSTRTWVRLLGTFLLLCQFAIGDCECGYSIGNDTNGAPIIFTDLTETDFVHVDITTDGRGKLWSPQGYNRSSEVARGPYGESYAVGNVLSNVIQDPNVFSGSGNLGSDAGLRLVVRGETHDDMVSVAETATTELDYFYGTFRVGMKTTDVPGTCSAFFWYQNDTQEIDIEFLSSQYSKSDQTFPVNLVLQSRDSASAGYNAANTTSFRCVNLPFDPTTDFHEYRFDFLADRVTFYADGNFLTELTGDGVPVSSGHLLISHWSNGNAGWSEGPPAQDAVTTVSYVKAYFNSSLEQRNSDFEDRCKDRAEKGAVCNIPNYAPTFFFSDGAGPESNQTIPGGGDDGSSGDGESGSVRRALMGSAALLWTAMVIVYVPLRY